MISVAIDGPAGAGKSTVAKMLSKRLGFLYFDTGALYRVLGYYFIKNRLNYRDPDVVRNNLSKIEVSFNYVGRQQKMFLFDEDVTYNIRSNEVSMAASIVSAVPETREFLLEVQRDVANKNNVIMDGRDIGTVVLPNADVKIFLTADVRVRAQRRLKQLRRRNPNIYYRDVLRLVKERDRNDRNRKISPLVPAKDAIIFNTTRYSLNQTIYKLTTLVRKRINGKKRIIL